MLVTAYYQSKFQNYKEMKKSCEAEGMHWDKFFSEMKDSLLFQMHRIHSVMFRVANGLIQKAAVPVKIEQLPVLMTVYDFRKLSQQEVADIISRDKSSVQRTVVALQKKGLVQVSADEKDKRKNILSTTETGAFVATQIRDIMKRVEEEIFEAFESKDRQNTINVIKSTADKLENSQYS